MEKNYHKIFLINRMHYTRLNDFKPEKIEDLEDIFYNPCRSKDRTRYLDSLKTDAISPDLEESAKRIFKLRSSLLLVLSCIGIELGTVICQN